MFMQNMEGGMNFGMPDVCLTPTPVGPIPIPYPNISTNVAANPATTAITVLTTGMPSINQASEVLLSQGDDPGVNMGVVSGMVMGPTEFLLGSFTVMVEGTPAQRLTTMTGQNGMSLNCPGCSIVPCQVSVLVLG